MKVTKCDRCNKEYNGQTCQKIEKLDKEFNVVYLTKTSKFGLSKYDQIDLCPDCLRKFAEFMDILNGVKEE